MIKILISGKTAVLYTKPALFALLLSYGDKVCIGRLRSLIMHLWANLITLLNRNILNFTNRLLCGNSDRHFSITVSQKLP